MQSVGQFLLVVCLYFVSVSAPLTAESRRQAPGDGQNPKFTLSDRDQDRLSDSLEEAIAEADPQEVFRVVVTYRGSPGNSAIARQQVGDFVVHADFRIIRGFSGSMRVAQIVALARTPGVFRIEEDFEIRARLDAARRDFGVERVQSDYAVRGSGCVICIVDTGVSPSHPQLDSKTLLFFDAVGGRAVAYDDQGHGTHVASIAAGDGTGDPQAYALRGVAPDSDVYAAKVLDSQGSGTESQVIQGIEWCSALPEVDIISMSLGSDAASDGQDALSQAVNEAVTAHGKILVTAAGNAGDAPYTVGSPAAAASSIAVGAVAEWSAPVGSERHSDGVYLAGFSSRGPTLAEIVKPDISAPGVSITAADAASGGYSTHSGTSMATPFASGAVALGLSARRTTGLPPLTPLEIRSILESTSQDRGPAGKDADWGAGLIDVSSFVGAMTGAAWASTDFPSSRWFTSSVADNGVRSINFDIGVDGLDVPIAAAITVDGQLSCSLPFLGICLAWEWSPDLDARLLDPAGNMIAYSGCAGEGNACGAYGRQETLAAMPTVPGTYTIEVWPFADFPNNGKGGTFTVDLSTGPVSTGSSPVNNAPAVSISSPAAGASVSGLVTVEVTADDTEDPPGTLNVEVSVDGGAWHQAAFNPTTGRYEWNWITTTVVNGSHSLRARATDSAVATSLSGSVSVGVSNASAIHVGDLDGSKKVTKNSWTASVAIEVHNQAHSRVPGAVVTGSWSSGGTGTCTTNTKGRCTIPSSKLANTVTTVSFTVGNVTRAGDMYDGTLNHDPEGNSNGSTITITR